VVDGSFTPAWSFWTQGIAGFATASNVDFDVENVGSGRSLIAMTGLFSAWRDAQRATAAA
jgi:hypothetical protein